MGQGLKWKPRAPILEFMFRYLSVREAVLTHALGFFTQLSLESLARTELFFLGGPWMRGVIFRAKRMFLRGIWGPLSRVERWD